MNEVLQYRFPESIEGETSGLAGHALGNLLIAAMTAVEDGDFEDGIRLMNRILAVRGQVVPVSPTPLTLHARLKDGSVVDGQSQVMRTPGIDRVWLTPDEVRPSEDALAAIADAELIVLGPGSLYTSLLPSLLIPAIRDAVARAQAPRIFVCNVATQEGETTGFDLADHVEALIGHTTPNLVDIVLANNHPTPATGDRGPGRSAQGGLAALAADVRTRPAALPRRRRGPRRSRIITSRPGWPGRSSARSRARPGSDAGPPAGPRAGAPEVSAGRAVTRPDGRDASAERAA